MRRHIGTFMTLSLIFTACGEQNKMKVVDNLPEPLAEPYPSGLRPLRQPPPRPRPVPSAPPPATAAIQPPVQPRAFDETAWMPPGGISARWKCIVIHHSASSAGDAATFDKAHRARNWDELGYHFVIGNGTFTSDGRIEVGPRWKKQKHGAHCKTPGNFYNDHGIGICLVGNFEGSSPTRAQMESLTRLTAFLMRKCHLPLNEIYTHGGITGKTACPGRNFSLNTIKARLAATTMADRPAYVDNR